jgi:hypothetical protein
MKEVRNKASPRRAQKKRRVAAEFIALERNPILVT